MFLNLRRRLGWCFCAAVVCLAASGCADSGPSLQYKLDVRSLMDEQNFNAADRLIDQNRDAQYGELNSVLFHLDRAVVLHDLERYEESDRHLDAAEMRLDELYTKDISKSAARYFVHDATEDFRGAPHVRTLLHIYRALNRLYMGQSDEAAVEARKVSLFLTELREKHDLKLSYSDDAFAHLLSALALEDAGEADNARLSLQKSKKAFIAQSPIFETPVPKHILQDLLFRDPEAEARAAEASALPKRASKQVRALDWRQISLSQTDEGNDAPQQEQTPDKTEESAPLPSDSEAAQTSSTDTNEETTTAEAAPAVSDIKTSELAAPSIPDGELVFIHYNGLLPYLTEKRLQIAGSQAAIYVREHPEELNGQNWREAHAAALSDVSFVIAIPELVREPSTVSGSVLECTDGSCSATATEIVSNPGAITAKTFAEQIGDIQARAGARAAIKFALTTVAQAATYAALKSRDDLTATTGAALVGLIGRIASSSTEHADTRSWLTAPAEIRMARIRLHPGEHHLRIGLTGRNGQILNYYELPTVKIVSGKRTYQHIRTAY